MGYFLTAEPEIAAPVNSLASPKTHGPFSRVEERGLRFLSPAVGRWLSRDPIGELGGLNLYCYCRNRPLDTFDLLGNEERTVVSREFDLKPEVFNGHPVSDYSSRGKGPMKVVVTVKVDKEPLPAEAEYTIQLEVKRVDRDAWAALFRSMRYTDQGMLRYMKPLRGWNRTGDDDFGVVFLRDTLDKPSEHVVERTDNNWTQSAAGGDAIDGVLSAALKVKLEVCPNRGKAELWLFYGCLDWFKGRSWGRFNYKWNYGLTTTGVPGVFSVEDLDVTPDVSVPLDIARRYTRDSKWLSGGAP